MKRFDISTRWICRRAGGLFIGVRYSFPCCILYDNNEARMTVHLTIGLLLFEVRMDFRGPVEDRD